MTESDIKYSDIIEVYINITLADISESQISNMQILRGIYITLADITEVYIYIYIT